MTEIICSLCVPLVALTGSQSRLKEGMFAKDLRSSSDLVTLLDNSSVPLSFYTVHEIGLSQ